MIFLTGKVQYLSLTVTYPPIFLIHKLDDTCCKNLIFRVSSWPCSCWSLSAGQCAASKDVLAQAAKVLQMLSGNYPGAQALTCHLLTALRIFIPWACQFMTTSTLLHSILATTFNTWILKLGTAAFPGWVSVVLTELLPGLAGLVWRAVTLVLLSQL